MPTKFPDRLSFERELWLKSLSHIAGVDEAGRGPLAGPVVAAAVVLPQRWLEAGLDGRLRDLNDSKQLTEAQRENYFAILTAHPEIRFAIAVVDAETIDRINILQATHRAMNDALAQLQPPPEHVLVDGRPVKTMRFPQTALVKGDAKSYSIAAASVLAKVTRDRLMLEFHRAAVHQHVLRLRPQLGQRLIHRAVRGLQDVDAVNHVRIHDGNRVTDFGERREDGEEIFALLFRELL